MHYGMPGEPGTRATVAIAFRIASRPSGVDAMAWGVFGTNSISFSDVTLVAYIRPTGTGSPQSAAPNKKCTFVFGYNKTAPS